MATHPSRFSKRTKIVAVSLLAAFFVIGGLYVYSLRTKADLKLSHVPILSTVLNAGSSNTTKNLSNTVSNGAVLTPTSTASPNFSGTQAFASSTSNGKTKATSNDLGVRVEYDSQVQDAGGKKNIVTKETGNKIYIYEEDKPNVYDYAQVFSKNANDTLQKAITTSLLSKYNTNDCVVSSISSANFPSNYQLATIKYSNTNLNPNGFPIDVSKCPSDYSFIEEPRYFLMDKNHPSKFVFIQGGVSFTDGTDAKGNLIGWDKSITLF